PAATLTPGRPSPTRRSSDLLWPRPPGARLVGTRRQGAALFGDPAPARAPAPPAAARGPAGRLRGGGVAGAASETASGTASGSRRSEEHTSELQSRSELVCRL